MTEKEFIAKLKRFRHLLPKQTVKTLRGQALSGDVQGATKGLIKALKKANVMDMAHRQTKVFVKHFGSDDYKGQFICCLREAHDVKRIVRGV